MVKRFEPNETLVEGFCRIAACLRFRVNPKGLGLGDKR